jgi:hypothetical protein
MTDFSKDESAVRDQLARINDAWQHLRDEAMTSALSPCFANEVVMRGPGFALAGKVAKPLSKVSSTSRLRPK